MTVESAKGECNFGQHEIAFKYDEALVTCDNHVIYKNGAKEIAAQEGMSITFMAKFNEREGNSCHIHLSFRGTDGSLVMADDADHEYRPERSGPLVHRGAAGAHEGADAAVRPEHQLLQALRRGVVRADGDQVGPGQPHLRVPPGRARRRAAAGEPRPRRRRQPLPGAGRHGRLRAGRHRARTGAGAGLRRQRVRLRRRARARLAGARGPAVDRECMGQTDLRRRGRGPLRQHGQGRAGCVRRARSPTGSGSAASSGSRREGR